jgi:alkyl hydroperoxide reductase subunit D
MMSLDNQPFDRKVDEGSRSMDSLEALGATLPVVAADIKHNLSTTLRGASTLSERQRWGVALASAYAARAPRLARAIAVEASALQDAELLNDAQAAALLMAQNNVYYRFRHFVGKPSYETTPARLRMTRVPAERRLDFELFALAISAIHGCESCVQHHEEVVVTSGLREQQVNDAMRIAATVYATAVALELEG